jgi:hypothetical protein
MYRILFNRFGVIAFQSTRSHASLIIISFWRLFAVAYSPAFHSIDIARCDGPTRRRLPWELR